MSFLAQELGELFTGVLGEIRPAAIHATDQVSNQLVRTLLSAPLLILRSKDADRIAYHLGLGLVSLACEPANQGLCFMI
jgi:hypothetical protein